MYQSAEEMVKESRNTAEQIVRLAEVTSLDSKKRAKVRFYGEDTEAGKTYTYIDGYIPAIGDKVLMLGQGNTFIIIGKVTDEEAVSKYVLKETFESHEHSLLESEDKTIELTGDGEVVPGEDSKYSLGTKANAFANGYIDNIVITYITIGGTKLAKEDIIAKLISGDYYVKLDDTELIPSETKKISLGTSSKMYKNVYAQSVYVDGKSVSPTKVISTSVSGREVELIGSVLTPSVDEIIDIGSESKRFFAVYGKRVYTDELYLDEYRIYPNRLYSDDYPDGRYIDFVGTALKPSAKNLYDIGTSTYQYKNVYAQNVYVNGSAITTSDKRKKKYIKKLADKYIEFFKKLRPVTFKYKKGKRTHAGFIAQEVEQAMQECCITNEEFGGLVIQENGEYGLRYEEFISLQTAVLQDLQQRVEELERRVKG